MNASAAIADSPLRQAWTRSDRRPGRRARHSVGQHPVQGYLPPSRARLWSLPRPLLQGGQPPCRIPTKGAHPLRNSQGGAASRLRGCVWPIGQVFIVELIRSFPVKRRVRSAWGVKGQVVCQALLGCADRGAQLEGQVLESYTLPIR